MERKLVGMPMGMKQRTAVGKVPRLGLITVASILLLSSSASAFCFREAGEAYGISPALLAGIAETESGMNAGAQNHNSNGSIDYGLMQINSSWLKSLGLSAQELLADPCLNAKTGARILRDCIDRFGYGWLAVGCYNASGTEKRARYAWKIFKQLRKGEDGSHPQAQKPQDAAREGEQMSRVAPSTLLFSVSDITD